MVLHMWMIWAFLAFAIYCVWGIMNGLVVHAIDPYSGIFFSSIGYLIAGIIALSLTNFNPTLSLKGVIYGLTLGLGSGLGGLFVLKAIHSGGNVSIIVVLSAIYPLGTLAFNYAFLGEHLSIQQIIGLILAVVSIILMTL